MKLGVLQIIKFSLYPAVAIKTVFLYRFIWQLFTTSQDEQDKFIGNVKDICGPYRDNILPMAICWLFGTVYKWSPDLLPIEVFQAFAYLDQNFPEDLENIRQQEQKAAQATPGKTTL